jgi:hypothetical protein
MAGSRGGAVVDSELLSKMITIKAARLCKNSNPAVAHEIYAS